MSSAGRFIGAICFWAILDAGLSCAPDSWAGEPQFAELGEAVVAQVVPECREVTDFSFSLDGSKVIYSGPMSSGDAQTVGVWVNDSLLMELDSVSEIGFAPSGEPFFVAFDNNRCFLYYNYVRPGLWEEIRDISFSADGKVVAYLASSRTWPSLVVSDGNGQRIDGVFGYALSRQGDRFAYVVRNEDDWFVVEGDDTSGAAEWIQDLTFSGDGAVMGYAAQIDAEWTVIVDGVDQGQFNSEVIEITDVVLSERGEHLAYVVTGEDTASGTIYQYPVVDGDEGEAYEYVSEPHFSRQGNRFAFTADDDAGQFIVIDGREEEVAVQVWGFSFSPDGRHYAYSARRNQQECVVVNGVSRVEREQVDRPVFSRNSARVGYGVLEGNEFLWVVERAR